MVLFPENYCLICHQRMMPEIGWRAIFSVEKERLICTECKGKLEKISGETCRICGRPLCLVEEKFRDGDLCHDCFRWEEDGQWQGFLTKNYSLFLYNEFVKEVIAKYKFRGDYALARVFAAYLKEVIKNLEADLFVPIPLSEVRLYERGFNQASALLVEAGLPSSEILTRIHSEKQSKKSRLERIHHPQVFKLIPEADIQDKKILLIDDVYTTGSTVRHAAKLLKQAGAQSIQSVTLAR
ncbi:ComF family protein [Neobacillus sp. OS1-32]|jgi:competence protein ComFC|uniref:ComF family protein n=1 Tax=Neobacillus paridis TaxID=2803862 RepID=A0ABS1TUQ7_9BACI|nr:MULTISPECIES: ComF family protein [Neobacillus]MBL4955036.1 ComF family protein [Neobacillus paridis]WML30045.1 ComF family protein [Neobacillus sp. OS1-32]